MYWLWRSQSSLLATCVSFVIKAGSDDFYSLDWSGTRLIIEHRHSKSSVTILLAIACESVSIISARYREG